MHPHTRVPFDEWIRKLDKHLFLTAEKFFEIRTTIYDAMRECRKQLNYEKRYHVLLNIDAI